MRRWELCWGGGYCYDLLYMLLLGVVIWARTCLDTQDWGGSSSTCRRGGSVMHVRCRWE
jgi:hypothetical protein